MEKSETSSPTKSPGKAHKRNRIYQFLREKLNIRDIKSLVIGEPKEKIEDLDLDDIIKN